MGGTAAGSWQRLRGLPAIGRGVSGAVRGSNPLGSLTANESQRRSSKHRSVTAANAEPSARYPHRAATAHAARHRSGRLSLQAFSTPPLKRPEEDASELAEFGPQLSAQSIDLWTTSRGHRRSMACLRRVGDGAFRCGPLTSCPGRGLMALPHRRPLGTPGGRRFLQRVVRYVRARSARRRGSSSAGQSWRTARIARPSPAPISRSSWLPSTANPIFSAISRSPTSWRRRASDAVALAERMTPATNIPLR